MSTSSLTAASDTHLSASYDPVTGRIRLFGDFVNGGPVLIYEAAPGKAVGPGTGTGISTLARGPGGSFATDLPSWMPGAYTIETIEDGVVSKTTVTVGPNAPPPVSPPPVSPPPVSPPPVPPLPGPPGATTYSPSVPQPARGSDIVGLNLQNPTGETLAAREVTFGQEFAPGQVPAGGRVVAAINGVTRAVQMDVKATNPDGSVRMAVLTLEQPSLAANATAGVMLSLAPVGAPAGTPVDISGLTKGGLELTVDLTLHNANGSRTPFHIDAAQALAAALKASMASYWLQGPQATQVRVDVPVSGSLHVTMDITAYADGATSTTVQFNNDDAMTASGGAVTYDAAITQNGKVAFQQSNIHQFQYQTWDQVIASNGAPQVNVQHDVAALQRAGFVQNYDLSTGVATALIAGEASQMKAGGATVLGAPSFGVLGNAGITQYMPETGGRADIGPTTQGNTLWLMTQNASAEQYALAQADAAGSVPWHLYDPTTGTDLTSTGRPTLWADGRGGSSGDTTGLTQPVPQYALPTDPQSGWAVDPAHQPDLSYDAYLMTGSRYYLDQLNAQASYDILDEAPSYRQAGQNVMSNGLAQVREQAWDLRGVEEAAFINPDKGPLKAYFEQSINNSFSYLITKVIPAATAAQGQAFGWLPGTYGSSANTMAPWEQDYFGQVVAMAAEQGNAQAKQVLGWESNFLVDRFLQGGNGFDPHDGVAYNLNTGPNSSTDYQTWAQIDAASGPSNSAADFSGTWAPQEYPGYQQWALATLAGSYTVAENPLALQAYGWLEAHTNMGGGFEAANPLYDIVPRLSDGQLLTNGNVHIAADKAGTSNTLQFSATADQLIYAGSGNDVVRGGSGINILFAGSGADQLVGGSGDDLLFGGAGAATLSGGAGHNWLQAGAGGTQFNLAAQDAAQDIISGFVPGRDHLHVTGTGGAAIEPPQIQAYIAGATASAKGLTLMLSAGHSVTINGMTPSQLTAAAFR